RVTSPPAGPAIRRGPALSGPPLRPPATACPRRSLALQLLGLALHVIDPAAHEERLLGDGVVLARGDGLEGGDGVAEGDEHARLAGELLGDEHGVGEEPLDAPGPVA